MNYGRRTGEFVVRRLCRWRSLWGRGEGSGADASSADASEIPTQGPEGVFWQRNLFAWIEVFLCQYACSGSRGARAPAACRRGVGTTCVGTNLAPLWHHFGGI